MKIGTQGLSAGWKARQRVSSTVMQRFLARKTWWMSGRFGNLPYDSTVTSHVKGFRGRFSLSSCNCDVDFFAVPWVLPQFGAT